jgi:hypothetical protein
MAGPHAGVARDVENRVHIVREGPAQRVRILDFPFYQTHGVFLEMRQLGVRSM